MQIIKFNSLNREVVCLLKIFIFKFRYNNHILCLLLYREVFGRALQTRLKCFIGSDASPRHICGKPPIRLINEKKPRKGFNRNCPLISRLPQQ